MNSPIDKYNFDGGLTIKYRYKSFKDEILGFVGVSEKELDIINTNLFQRLRRVMQLDIANLVYPNASHNRFTHSLGVMFLATKMLEEMFTCKERENNALDPSEKLRITGEIRIVSLLHDIGHYALSHCGENALKRRGGPKKAHERMSILLVKDEMLRTPVEEAANDCGSSLEEIMRYMKKSPKDPRYVFQILDSGLDADKIDYLIRDSYHTGVASGFFDRGRLFQMLRCKNDAMIVDPKGISVIESYLFARYEMYNQLYFHKTVQSFRRIAEEILIKLMDYGLISTFEQLENEPQLLQFDDDYKFFALVNKTVKGTLRDSECKQIDDKPLKYLADCLFWRKRIPIAFEKYLFVPRIKTLNYIDNEDKIEKFNGIKAQLEEGELDDRIIKICNSQTIPPESVVVEIYDLPIARVSNTIPPVDDELTDSILLPIDSDFRTEGIHESLMDMINGAELNGIRVFAPDKVNSEIGKLFD